MSESSGVDDVPRPDSPSETLRKKAGTSVITRARRPPSDYSFTLPVLDIKANNLKKDPSHLVASASQLLPK